VFAGGFAARKHSIFPYLLRRLEQTLFDSSTHNVRRTRPWPGFIVRHVKGEVKRPDQEKIEGQLRGRLICATLQ